ncbi:MAG: 6-phosphogluconolactonase [Myxococcota bacterium]
MAEWRRCDDPLAAAASTLAAGLDGVAEPRIAIPGGSAVAALPALRVALGPARWAQTTITWVDERCVPPDHPDSNQAAAARTGALAGVGVTVPLWRDGDTFATAQARFEAHWRAHWAAAPHPGLHALLLGVGGDGHIASLFPGRPRPTEGRIAAVSDSPKPPSRRLTLTPAALATASTVVVLALGEGKRDALTRITRGDPELVASTLHPTIVTDIPRELPPS